MHDAGAEEIFERITQDFVARSGPDGPMPEQAVTDE
jgi:hypothetical protein